MFADVMVRVTGFAFVTSTPSAVSEPDDSKPSGGVCSCSPARQTAVTPCITGLPSVSVSGVLFTRILCSPFTGPSIGPSPMASITLIICVDLRLSFASTGVCALPPPLPTLSPSPV
ncbi:superoxide dismutase [Escherichia coli O26:H11]|nr:superoxide dismutase [Escherichia coli O26:H11]